MRDKKLHAIQAQEFRLEFRRELEMTATRSREVRVAQQDIKVQGVSKVAVQL
jgi:hypothetical protein